MQDPGAAERIALYGTDEPLPKQLRLEAGALTALFADGNLRAIRWGGVEVLRAIAFIIRDSRWGTYRLHLSPPEVATAPGRFHLRYSGEATGSEGRFLFEASIEGEASGRLRFAASGIAPEGFLTNRTGFVVLHGLEGVVGHPVAVTHTDGARETAVFPQHVSPDQPVFDIARLEHEPQPGLRVAVAFEGDAFEMEDHRNWTDASFKTYVRPLSRGFPYRIAAGERLDQSVTLTIAGAAPAVTPEPEALTLSWGAETGGVLPRIGLFVDEGAPLPAAVAGQLADIRPAYLQGRVDLRAGGLAHQLDRLLALAAEASAALDLDIVIPGRDPAAELAPLAPLLDAPGREPRRLFVVPARDLESRTPRHTPPGEASAEAILSAARARFPGRILGCGMPIAFPEFNRNRPPPGADFVAHATQAIIHAADDASVMETLEALPHVIGSGRVIAPGLPYRLGPATIGLPAMASGRPLPNPDNTRMPLAGADPRQRGRFGAAFALGLAAVCRVEDLTLAAPTGAFGLFHVPQPNPTPGFERPGTPYPIAAIVAALARLGGAARFDATSPAPGRLAAVAGRTVTGPALLFGNLTPARLVVQLAGPDAGPARALVGRVEDAGDGRLALAPYACVALGPGLAALPASLLSPL